jgi:hypothetical protein
MAGIHDAKRVSNLLALNNSFSRLTAHRIGEKKMLNEVSMGKWGSQFLEAVHHLSAD